MDDRNNLIYRYIRTAYHFKDSDLIEIWSKAGFDMSMYKVKRYYRNCDHKDYQELSTKKLKAFLVAVVSHLDLKMKGVSLETTLGQILEKEGLHSSGNLVLDARSLRDKLSP